MDMTVSRQQPETEMITFKFTPLVSALCLTVILAISPLVSSTHADAAEAGPRNDVSKVRGGNMPEQLAQNKADRQPNPAVPTSAERARRLVIFFHGIRGRGSVLQALSNSWAERLPDTEFVSPDAPFAHRAGGRQWFVVDDQVMRPDRIAAARKAFDELVSEIVRREGFENDLKSVAFVAVSQGAVMALDAVASGRWKVGALVSFAGSLPLPPTSSSTDTPILLMHGGADRTIPSAASVAAQAQLKSVGYDVTVKIYPDVGHTISSEEAREAALFLSDRLE